MRVLHDHAIVTGTMEITRDRAGSPEDPILDASLLSEFERIKISHDPVSLDDLSKLWSALPQTSYRRSVVYEVDVVQIECRAERRIALPVQRRRVLASTARRPEITAAYRRPADPAHPIGDIRVRPSEDVAIEGKNFLAERLWVRFGHLEPIRVPPTSNGRIAIAVPDDAYPEDLDHSDPRPISKEDRLQPGALLVQVIATYSVEAIEGGLDKGQTVTEARQFRSNQAVLQLVPQVTGVDPLEGTAANLLTVNGRRLYHEDLKSYVILGDAAIEVSPPGTGDPWAAPTPTAVQVPLAPLAQALKPPTEGRTYPVRVQVNGAVNREDGVTFLLRP